MLFLLQQKTQKSSFAFFYLAATYWKVCTTTAKGSGSFVTLFRKLQLPVPVPVHSVRLGSFSIKFKHNHNIQLGPVHPRDCNFELVICTSIKTYQDLTFEVTLWNGRARGVRSSLTATSTQTYFYMKETNQKT